ncbi:MULTISPECIES: HNH endonuclease [unclassified Flavobacterium]|uniref:HNH endonuclease n=1 Tax=unclassified Flavobacterium TaxID=196869 RepID=UPI001F13467E|nr:MULTISPECIES: HNH endonuclease signature motif containing protein [unclassified Flavobacterium]UMY66451.1 HNH endonuclease [Flavobacterium sp. HJ-32-4]
MKKISSDLPALKAKLESLLGNFEKELESDDLRRKVKSIIPIFHLLRDTGKSLIPKTTASSARDRILFYFKKYPRVVISGDELLVVSGIQEYARRIRELRVQFGWSIITGMTAKEMAQEDDLTIDKQALAAMKPDDYLLLSDEQDRDAALRWNIANDIRKRPDGVKMKLLEYLKANVGKPVTGEELRYVANNATEWARRVRELRTEEGWSVVSKSSGRPDLPIGTYVLESDRQSPTHDRRIPDSVRSNTLRRDNYTCQNCGWTQEEWNRSDPRHLELHHIISHKTKGANTEENLITLCTVCHDEVHRKEKG